MSLSGSLIVRLRAVDSRVFAALAFLVPFAVRFLPELFMGGFVVGFDTVGYYVPVVSRLVRGGVGLLEVVSYAPLFYGLLAQLVLAGVPLTAALKVLPPVLLGFLGSAIYFYARTGLEWSCKKGLFVSCLATLYFVGLRVSWDMLRSELGLIFLFVFLAFLWGDWREKPWKCYTLLLPSMVFVVLSHQLVSVIMFVTVSAVVLQNLFKREYGAVRNLVLSALPSVGLFCLIVYAGLIVSPGSSIGESMGWFSLFGFSSYADVLVGTLGFLCYCYLPLLAFVLFGIRGFRSLELRVWLCWCLFGVLLGTLGLYGLIPVGYRWTLLMVFPLAFFAVEGFGRFKFRRLKIVLSGVLVFLSLSFVLLPAGMAFPYFGLFPNYVPSSMLQNSVALSDCGDVVKALAWVNGSLCSGDVLLVHDAFYGWSLLYLDRARVVCYGYENPQTAARETFADGCRRLFLVWWVSGDGWHGWSTLPPCFVEVYRSNRIAVYEYVES
jgi:hypothetical protein